MPPEPKDRDGLIHVASTPGYLVSEDGRVFSTMTGKLRPIRMQSNGRYLTVGIRVNGKTVTRFVHGLMCEAFHGPRPAGHQVRHLNNDKFDNRPVNLAWGTLLENMADKYLHGTAPVGENNPRALLTEEEVLDIRARVAAGETRMAVAASYGMVAITIDQVVSGASWGHLPIPDMSNAVTRHGERNVNAKLNPTKVKDIRRLARDGVGRMAIARMFGMSRPAIRSVIVGTTWKHVRDE